MKILDVVFGFAEKVPGWLWLVILLGPVVAMLVFHLSLGIRRHAMWERTALALGFAHQDEDPNLANTFKSLGSFADLDGFQTRSLDVLSKGADGVQTWLLDHGSGKPRKLCTVCVMRTGELQVPHFRLWPAGGWLRPPKEQVVFPDDPEFARRFILTTDNPEAIKRLFDPALRQYFLRMFQRCREIEKANTHWVDVLMLRLSNAIGRFDVEAAGDTLSVHLSRLINPRGAPEVLALTAETLHILKSKQREVSPLSTPMFTATVRQEKTCDPRRTDVSSL
jgi:hypothetical protein